MATPVAKPAATDKAAEALLGKPHGGMDVRRPFRYAASFVGGTVRDGLNFCATGGRKGMWVGGGLGLLAMMSGAGVIMIFMGMVGGLAAGAVGGMALGAATGGARGMARTHRIERNADQMAHREETTPVRQKMISRGPDYREYYRQQRSRNNYLTDRQMAVQRETERDIRESSGSWVDSISGESHGHSRW